MKKITALSVKEARENYLKSLPPRLQRLNRELAIDRSKDFDNELYAVRDEFRFKISVFRHDSSGFIATTKAAGRVHRYSGQLPSDAYLNLVRSLAWVVSRLKFEKEETARQLRQMESVAA